MENPKAFKIIVDGALLPRDYLPFPLLKALLANLIGLVGEGFVILPECQFTVFGEGGDPVDCLTSTATAMRFVKPPVFFIQSLYDT